MFYIGQTHDGSDMRQAPGMYMSPCGKYWSNEPITREQKEEHRYQQRIQRIHNEIFQHSNGKSFAEEYELIKSKQSILPRSLRDYLIDWFENIDNL